MTGEPVVCPFLGSARYIPRRLETTTSSPTWGHSAAQQIIWGPFADMPTRTTCIGSDSSSGCMGVLAHEITMPVSSQDASVICLPHLGHLILTAFVEYPHLHVEPFMFAATRRNRVSVGTLRSPDIRLSWSRYLFRPPHIIERILNARNIFAPHDHTRAAGQSPPRRTHCFQCAQSSQIQEASYWIPLRHRDS